MTSSGNDNLFSAPFITENVKQMAEGFLRNAQTLMQDKENDLDSAKKQLEGKLEETEAKEKFLDEKARQVNSRKHSSLLGPKVFPKK